MGSFIVWRTVGWSNDSAERVITSSGWRWRGRPGTAVAANYGRMSGSPGASLAVRKEPTGSVTAALLFLLLFVNELDAVKITNIEVPEIIQYGVQESVVLDCDYVYGNNTSGLVVKWFFKNKSRPVYQWIPTTKPQDMGILRGKVDLSYKVSEDALKMHRALRILNPGTNISGDYTCVVSTFMEEDQRTKRMIVFVPETNFRLIQNKTEDETVNVICSADGAFPAPNLTLATPDRHLEGAKHSLVLVGGRYSATASITLRDAELPAPAEFICTLRIPQANYVVRKEAIYYPGPISTTPELPTAADMQLAAAVGSEGRRLLAALTLLLAPMFVFIL